MKVKKTKAGKFVVELDWNECDALYSHITNWLETESARLLFIKLDKAEHFRRHEHFYAVNHFLLKYFAKLVGPSLNQRLTMKPLEAFILLHFLWGCELKIGLKDVRSQLHQLLS
jgi:hypothetical protein